MAMREADKEDNEANINMTKRSGDTVTGLTGETEWRCLIFCYMCIPTGGTVVHEHQYLDAQML